MFQFIVSFCQYLMKILLFVFRLSRIISTDLCYLELSISCLTLKLSHFLAALFRQSHLKNHFQRHLKLFRQQKYLQTSKKSRPSPPRLNRIPLLLSLNCLLVWSCYLKCKLIIYFNKIKLFYSLRITISQCLMELEICLHAQLIKLNFMSFNSLGILENWL